ncbi:MAG: MarR family transcriptional regulator, partial [Pseudomonadota bacterium]
LIQPASLSRMLETLEGRGWVSRAVSTTDKRQRVVTMTPAGQDIFDRASIETERAYEDLEDDLGATYAPAIKMLRELTARMENQTAPLYESA